MEEEKQGIEALPSPELAANTAGSSGRRSFMKSVVAGAVATGGLAAVAMTQNANAAPQCGPFPFEDLKQLTTLIQSYGGKLVDYFPCGQPAPTTVFGTVSIAPEAVGALINALVKFDKIRLNYEVFPYGIPYPEFVNIKFKSPGVGGY